MLKHVGHHRSTSSMTRTSSNSLKVRGEPMTPKIIRTQDDSVLPYETTMAREVLFSSPEFVRKQDLTTPATYTSDPDSPEIIRRSTKSGRSQSLQSSPVLRKRLLDVPEGFESSFRRDFLDVPRTFQNPGVSGGCQDSDDDPHSSPEIPKREIVVARPSTLPRRGTQRASSDMSIQKLQVARKSLRSADTSSIASIGSFSSFYTGRLTSRASSTSSLADQTVIPVKVYLRFMKPDTEYKTMRLSTSTTCRQLIALLLAKFRMRHRDPNLFFVRMEITVRSPGVGAPARRILVLDEQARPAELQQCRPRGDARFSVGVRRGGLLRIHDSILMPGSQYKSLLVSYRTTAEELVQLLLNCYNNKESPRHYAIHEVNKCPYSDRQLRHDDFPLLIQSEWPRPSRQNYSFVLRRNANYALRLKSRISWRRSLDHSGTDTESEHEDHLATRKTRAPSLPFTHASYTHASYRRGSSGNLLNEPLTVPPPRTFNPSSMLSNSSLSPSMSRISCDSGFSSPSSSSRSSTASTGSPSPPGSPSPSTSTRIRSDGRYLKSSNPSVSASLLKSSPAAASSGRIHHQPVTVTVNQVTVPSSQPGKANASTSSHRNPTPIHRNVIAAQDNDLYGSCLLTIPLSPIPVPQSPPPLSVLSSSVVVTALSPVSSSPAIREPSASTRTRPTRPPSTRGTLRTNPLYSTFFVSDQESTFLDIPPEGSTIIPPSSAPHSPCSPTPSLRCVLPSPSAPTSPSRNLPPPLQTTIITIPSSGPSIVSSNTLSASATAGIRELTAALESLRTLTIRCPNYDNCFYI